MQTECLLNANQMQTECLLNANQMQTECQHFDSLICAMLLEELDDLHTHEHIDAVSFSQFVRLIALALREGHAGCGYAKSPTRET
jgi:hypothetical protein